VSQHFEAPHEKSAQVFGLIGVQSSTLGSLHAVSFVQQYAVPQRYGTELWQLPV
jgi:hypothetical protein